MVSTDLGLSLFKKLSFNFNFENLSNDYLYLNQSWNDQEQSGQIKKKENLKTLCCSTYYLYIIEKLYTMLEYQIVINSVF